MPQDSVGAEDGDSFDYNHGGKDWYMPQDSVCTDDGDSCEYYQGGKDCHMPKDSVGAEDGDSCEYNQEWRDGKGQNPLGLIHASGRRSGQRRHS